ncbi:toxin-antitoxin system YwqK family antitoxin [Pseudomonas fluorescens]|nr:toxin-antitoxin system YwqK family antitoxin [Pseudomonas fluorescens]
MSAQGQREGKSIVRHKNGKIEKSINYNNGIITDGEYITYDPTGKIKIREHYANGVLNGPRVKLYANGNPESMEKYLDGSRSGISNYYYEDGTLKNIQDYDRGQLDGWDVKYFANGQTESQTLYTNQHIRISHEWNIDGIKVSQWEQDENHNRQGDDIEWYDNGQKRKHSIYKDGKLHGKMQGWSEDGTQLYSTRIRTRREKRTITAVGPRRDVDRRLPMPSRKNFRAVFGENSALTMKVLDRNRGLIRKT